MNGKETSMYKGREVITHYQEKKSRKTEQRQLTLYYGKEKGFLHYYG